VLWHHTFSKVNLRLLRFGFFDGLWRSLQFDFRWLNFRFRRLGFFFLMKPYPIDDNLLRAVRLLIFDDLEGLLLSWSRSVDIISRVSIYLNLFITTATSKKVIGNISAGPSSSTSDRDTFLTCGCICSQACASSKLTENSRRLLFINELSINKIALDVHFFRIDHINFRQDYLFKAEINWSQFPRDRIKVFS
jgi:hypothetical protein